MHKAIIFIPFASSLRQRDEAFRISPIYTQKIVKISNALRHARGKKNPNPRTVKAMKKKKNSGKKC